jgi:rhomboid family GlyGly-CTERM serine protease
LNLRSAWIGLSALLAAGALVGWLAPSAGLDWQPGRAAAEPWRAFSAAFVHWSERHLLANLAGLALVAALGAAARLPRAAALAWLVAWPLTHLGLLARPELAHYGGLSGVLHAGVSVAAIWLVVCARGRTRLIAGAVVAGLAVKIVLERPWGAALVRPADWDIAIAPLAHATGALAGLLAAALALLASALARGAARQQSSR